MICPYCGSPYPDKELKCPFCESENIQEAQRRHQKELKREEMKAFQILKLPQKIVAMASQVLKKSGLSFSVFVLVLAAVVFFTTTLILRQKKEQKAETLLVLEQLYSQSNYIEIYAYTKEKNLYKPTYDKYTQIGKAQHYLEMTRRTLDEFKKNYGEKKMAYLLSDLEWALSYANDSMEICLKGMNDNGITGNENDLSKMYQSITDLLCDSYHLSKEEIEEIAAFQNPTPEDLSSYARFIYDRY